MVLFAKDVVEPVFLSLPRDVTALDAAKIMREKNQGFVVVSKDGVPEGIVTEWDYIAKVVSEAVDPAKVTLGQLMTAGLISVQGGDGLDVVAPLRGRFYARPEPGAPPFVSVGSEVTEDTTVGLIEVMKTFNAVRAGIGGVVTEICVQDAQLVEYGEVLFHVRPHKTA